MHAGGGTTLYLLAAAANRPARIAELPADPIDDVPPPNKIPPTLPPRFAITSIQRLLVTIVALALLPAAAVIVSTGIRQRETALKQTAV
jgi:hypothetical protein